MGNITFPAATYGWGTITHAGLFNADGVMVAEVPLKISSPVNQGDTVNVDLDLGEETFFSVGAEGSGFYGGGNSSVAPLYDSVSVGAGGSGFYDVSGGGKGGCLTSQLSQLTTTNGTGTYMYVDASSNYKKEEDMIEVCQFCGEPKVRELVEKKLVKGQWKTRTTYYYKCGTSKTVGNYKVKKPRVRIAKGCVGFKK